MSERSALNALWLPVQNVTNSYQRNWFAFPVSVTLCHERGMGALLLPIATIMITAPCPHRLSEEPHASLIHYLQSTHSTRSIARATTMPWLETNLEWVINRTYIGANFYTISFSSRNVIQFYITDIPAAFSRWFESNAAYISTTIILCADF